jgi:phosphoglycerate dehydrogenase-like enzyme
MAAPFRLGITRDFLQPDGSLGFGDIGLDLLGGATHVAWEFLAEYQDEMPRQVADQYDALLVLKPRITARTLDGCRRLSLVARFGVGYDSVDVEACTRNHVLLTITPDGVRRPVAVSALAFLLALSHKLPIKDRLTRAGRWDEKLTHMGVGLTGRVLGVIGLGNIGRELLRVAAPLEMRRVGFDPYVTREQTAAAGAEWMEIDSLLAVADFVVICCALTPETHRLLDQRRLALLRPSAYLINVARGPIVDQAALTTVLRERRIAGAALDVFEQEPISPTDPLLQLDNVILAPHAICWTDELFRDNGRSALQSVLAVASGQFPRHVVNTVVLESRPLREKLSKFAT